jgi:acetyl esterase/lipase
MRALAGVALLALLAGFVNVHAHSRAQVSTPASIAAESPCRFTTFEDQTSLTRRFYSKAEYDLAKANASTECLRIQYLSDGLKVVGFLVKPRDPEGRRYPVIIYNRGGLQDSGKIDGPNILDFYELAANGFVVLASQYRGNDGGEGLEEFGGADVGDVVTLVSVASSLPYADPKNIFFYGMSRGGMMTFLALARGVTVHAAAVVGGIYDLHGLMESTKQRMPGIANRVTKLIPEYSSRGANNRRDRDARIVAWFKRHLR